jgi:leucine dehydrogenase
VYAPDYVINAGGVINVADELYGYNRDRAFKRVETIYDSLTKIYAISKTENIPTYLAANRLAESRIERVGKMRSTFLQNEKSILNGR